MILGYTMTRIFKLCFSNVDLFYQPIIVIYFVVIQLTIAFYLLYKYYDLNYNEVSY